MIGHKKKVAQKCEDCINACGGCSFTELDENGNLKMEPVPGWKAEKVVWKPYSKKRDKTQYTYRVIDCPLYKQAGQDEKPRKRYGLFQRPILSTNIYTGQQTIYESVHYVNNDGFEVEKANICVLSGRHVYNGHRFSPAPDQYIPPCFKCGYSERRKCRLYRGACETLLQWQKEHMRVRVVQQNVAAD